MALTCLLQETLTQEQSILGIESSVEIFYTTDDVASTLNEVDLSVSPETIAYESFNDDGLGDFLGQSTTGGTGTASTSASSTTGWSPSDGGNSEITLHGRTEKTALTLLLVSLGQATQVTPQVSGSTAPHLIRYY